MLPQAVNDSGLEDGRHVWVVVSSAYALALNTTSAIPDSRSTASARYSIVARIVTPWTSVSAPPIRDRSAALAIDLQRMHFCDVMATRRCGQLSVVALLVVAFLGI